MDKNVALIKKYDQLELNFDDFFAKSPYNPESKLSELQKIYIPQEFVNYPFFLAAKSNEVKKSRVGYIANQKYQKLIDSGVSEDEANKQSEYKTSPGTRKKHFSDTIETDTTKIYAQWIIKSDEDYGLPDDFDGQVWDIIISHVSWLYKVTSKFYQVYFFTQQQILDELIKRNVFSSKGGKQYTLIKDSLHRLKRTIYSHKTGLKDAPFQYEISLISNLFFSGEKLPDDTITHKIAIIIDPLIIYNFKRNKYIISNNEQRSLLEYFKSKTLFDKFSYLAHVNFKSNRFPKLKAIKVKPHIVFGYKKLCIFLGYTPKTGTELRPSKIKKQFKKVHYELEKYGIIEELFVDRNPNAEDPYNLIYVFNKKFLENVLKIYSKDYKLSMNEEIKPSKELMAEMFKIINRQIKSKEIKDSLLF